MAPELSIITINYNGLQDTCELLETLPLKDERLEVIVVDNASKNDETTLIEQRFPQVTVIRSEKNLGFAGGNNLGIKASHGKYLFFVNNDTVFKREKPIQYAGYTPLSSITMRNRSIGFGEPDRGQYDKAHTTPYAHGAAMMVKREVIEKAGLMPECYFLYYEELDWSMMIRRAGYEIWYEPACIIYHKESQATGQNSPLKTYFITRNRLLFNQRNQSRPIRWLTTLYLIGIVAAKDILKYYIKRRPDLASATMKGVFHYLKN